MGNSIQSGIRKQTNKMLRTGQRFKSFEQIRQRHFWSSYYFQPDANGYIPSGRYPLFTTPVGSNGQGFPSGIVITERESNWKSQNRIPDNQNFEVTELGCGLLAQGLLYDGDQPLPVSPANFVNLYAVPTAIQNFWNSAVLEITYLTNSVPLGLLCDFAQASGQYNTISSNTGIAPNLGIINGFAAPALRRRFKIPILLQHGESFSFTISVPRNTFVGFPDLPAITDSFMTRLDFWATESFVEKS